MGKQPGNLLAPPVCQVLPRRDAYHCALQVTVLTGHPQLPGLQRGPVSNKPAPTNFLGTYRVGGEEENKDYGWALLERWWEALEQRGSF